LDGVVADRGLVLDIRPATARREEGPAPEAIVVERTALEWRLDPTAKHCLEQVHDYDQPLVVVCSEGRASSLAAASLADLGYTRVADLVGGYQAWRTWFERRRGAQGGGAPR